jgi:pyrroloquinoline-quinone synthase
MVNAHAMTVTEASAKDMLRAAPIVANAYFRSLESGEMSKGDFVRSQIQFSYAVGYFSQNLATLIARMPRSSGRAVLVQNLAEEHGWDEENPAAGFRGHLAHDQTFATFLGSLGVEDASVAESHAEPPVRAFNLALNGACGTEPAAFALAALGMIEYAFADISALIGRRVVELGWVEADKLVHYSLHAEIDQRHAAELFEAAGDASADAALISGGLAFGRYLFDRLYRDLI